MTGLSLGEEAMKRTMTSIIAVLVISVGIYEAYASTNPLTKDETYAVVGIVALLVTGVQWIVSKVGAKKSVPDTPEKHD
jgi:hypothetical protein